MVIKRNMVADIYYQMKDELGNIADSNHEYSPLQYLHGYNNIIPSLEDALEGLSINDEKWTTLITSLTNDNITLDGNHPIVEKKLSVHVKVVAIREATPEEIEQGQPVLLKSGCCGATGCC